MERAVLIVDDSATVRKFVSTSLMVKGIRVVTACDGLEALEKLPRENIGLVITDLNMPDMDGFELIKHLRQSPEYRNIPVIVLSSVSDEQDKDRARTMGASAYLEKPFDARKIQFEVARFVN